MKQLLLAGLFILLLLPLAQQVRPFIHRWPLRGAYRVAPKPELSVHTWLDGSYQQGEELYLNDHMGFRTDFVRLNNQVDYSLFNKIHAEWIVVGREHYLYQYPYIDSYYGKDYVGYDTIHEKIRKFKAVQDTLARLGKSLILVHAPCKALYYPGFFPPDSVRAKRGPTNFETYVKVADSAGINQVDFNSWFVSMRDTSRELLYSKKGIHWSIYGSILAGDSLVKCMERLQHIHMPHPYWHTIDREYKARYTDDDLAQLLNMYVPLVKERYSYPRLQYTANTAAKRPKVIFIGDSFCITMMQNGMLQNTTTDWEIWFYFREVYTSDYLTTEIVHPLRDCDWQGSLNKADCIVIMYTSHNLKELGDGFIEQMYARYYPGK